MAMDEKIKEICNVLEYLLKENKKFISLNYNEITAEFLDEKDIILGKRFNALDIHQKKVLKKEKNLMNNKRDL